MSAVFNTCSFGLGDKRGGSLIAAEIQVLLQREVERRAHLGKRPMRNMHNLEAARQALRETLLHQERRRTEQNHLERTPGTRVLVPRRFTVSDQPEIDVVTPNCVHTLGAKA